MLELTTFQGDLDADGFDGDAQLLDFDPIYPFRDQHRPDCPDPELQKAI